jgi:hypothetical protein
LRNCLQAQVKAGAEYVPCNIFAGREVHAKGWCKVYVKRRNDASSSGSPRGAIGLPVAPFSFGGPCARASRAQRRSVRTPLKPVYPFAFTTARRDACSPLSLPQEVRAMRVIKWEPFRDVDDMFDRFFAETVRRWPRVAARDQQAREWAPMADVSETDGEYIIKAELPRCARKT